jgi:hypothetical protein
MKPGTYEICPVIDGMPAWPWGQIVINPLTPSSSGYPRGSAAGSISSRFPDPRRVEPAGASSDGAWVPPSLRAVGHYFDEEK